MRRASLPLLALPLALGLALAAPATAQEERTISVTGRGEVAAAPDMAVIGLGVVEEGETARAAMDAASDAAAAVLARLEEIGIAERDIQTSDLHLSPIWSNPGEGQQRAILGFEASNQLTVRVRDLSGLGAVLDAVVSDGANRFGGLRFT
ncbi:MAG: SIMPL domain-containing protein, partial [Rhodosalinus sp.]